MPQMMGFYAEIIQFIGGRSVTRTSVVQNFPGREPDATRKALWELLRAGFLTQSTTGRIWITDHVKEERKPRTISPRLRAITIRRRLMNSKHKDPSRYDEQSRRKCTKCRRFRSLENYSADHNGLDGLKSYCKQCLAEASKLRRALAAASYIVT